MRRARPCRPGLRERRGARAEPCRHERDRLVERIEHAQAQRDDLGRRRLQIGHGDDGRARAGRGERAEIAVLECDAGVRGHVQPLGREPVDRRIGLAARDFVAARDRGETLEHADRVQPRANHVARGRRRDRARHARLGEHAQQRPRARLERKFRMRPRRGELLAHLRGHRAERVVAEQAGEDRLAFAERAADGLQVVGRRQRGAVRARDVDPRVHDGPLGIDEQAVHIEDCRREHAIVPSVKARPAYWPSAARAAFAAARTWSGAVPPG
ncbi:hypothetical protein T210_0108590 [Burkholderia pseudomallei MSHR6137]|nr:hypothetical protein T210_0108590 [Burkholderia pseudomallei MSHR6137]